MSHHDRPSTEGEFLGKETPQGQAASVTHITNNVVIQQMDVYPGDSGYSADHGEQEQYGVQASLSPEDELAQHVSLDLDARLNRYFKGKAK